MLEHRAVSAPPVFPPNFGVPNSVFEVQPEISPHVPCSGGIEPRTCPERPRYTGMLTARPGLTHRGFTTRCTGSPDRRRHRLRRMVFHPRPLSAGSRLLTPVFQDPDAQENDNSSTSRRPKIGTPDPANSGSPR